MRPGFLRLILYPEEREALEGLSVEVLDAELDRILYHAPDQGEILWQHQDYYTEQMFALRDALLGWR